MLDWLPFWIFHLIVLVGLGGLIAAQFFKFIPFVTKYYLPIQVISIITLSIGIYMEGGISNQEKWEARVKELETKVAIAEEKSKTANVELASKIKEKTKIVKEIQLVVQEKIVKDSSKIDAECKVAPEAISILNQAAESIK